MYPRGGCRNKEKGAITVFLALIFMSLIIFAGAIIDIVRITAADRKVQSVLNSSARSVLADYDRELIGGYGIYGINTAGNAVRDDFYRYLSVNLEERHKGIRFIDIRVDREDVEIQGMDSLLNDDAFKHQIQEYMKYRTPIAATDSLIEQLQNIKLGKKVEFVKSEKATRDKARELRTKANDVNAKLAGIKKKMADLSVEKLEEISKELSEALIISGSIYDESGGSLLDDYNDSRSDTNTLAKDGECIENQSEEFVHIKEGSESLTPELQEYMAEVNRTLDKLKPIIRDVKDLEEELEDLESEPSALEQDIKNIKDKIEQLEFSIAEEMSELETRLGGFSLEGYTLKEESVQLSNKKTEDLRGFINETKEEITKALLRRLEKDWLISIEEFDSSNLIIGEDFGVMDEMTHYNSAIKEEEAEKSNDTIVKSMERLAKAVEEAASSAVGKLNTIEYIMDKYTFLTSKTERNHYFRKGEVEYIIGGSDTEVLFNSIKNTEYYAVTNVLLQVWALRFAIDAIDEFIRSTIIFPPQRLAFALAEGALDSSLDMFNMLNGKEVPICPKSFTAVRLKYSDHLKILLLMKPEEEILRKARQLMQVNIKNIVDAKTELPRKDFRMGEYSTVISASVTAKVNLFFLPLLKVDRLIPDSFEGGRYIIRKQIHVGY
ncbi:MAG: hypothetical protein ACYCYE_13355 [Clostridia bacterium]